MNAGQKQINAIVEGGKIVSGGVPCHRCGSPSLAFMCADPFGKSDRMVAVCDNCAPWKGITNG